MNDLKKKLRRMVVEFISDTVLDETTIDDKISEVSGMPTFSSLSEDEIEEVKASIKSDFSIKLDKGVLIEEKNHEKWFLARKSKLSMKYWERYKSYLLSDKGFSIKVVNSMDDILDTLTDLLGDPERDIKYKRRGLIIGDVQSGKTANYTGLICKAVDAGYKVVVLLTGTIEKLRQQTQARIDEGFVGRDSDALIKQQEDKIVIGVGKYDPSISPVCLTSTSDDFKQKNAMNLNFDLRNINGSVIFVVKKNSAVLKRLNKWLRTFNQNGDNPIDNSILLIDDEADNASVNTKDSESPTVINGQIREMLKSFTKSSYVGFTATPFANIFIDPDDENEMFSEDLFPKDYIYSLNAPSNYIGARNIFSEDGDESEMLVEINDNTMDPTSIEVILPLKHKSDIRVNHIPEDMKNAIAAFVLANVIQDLDGKRKRENTHRSMLINVSRFTAVQEQVSDFVNEYLKNIQSACRLYGRLSTERALQDEYICKLKEVYDDIYYDNIGMDWVTIQENLYGSCAGIVVKTINQKSGKNLDFNSYKDGLRMIAVGGMSLSRGLTLEGLVISYFYRNSKMYDTLMQMGRWFGYRTGYADLCRIWMSEESIEWYRYISEATDELREEVKRYQDSDLTPKDFGLRVRSDITTLIVTARNKMGSAEPHECVISLSGETIETPELFADKEKNKINYSAVIDLIEEMKKAGILLIKEGNKLGYRDVPASFIMDILEKIEVSPTNEEFNTVTIRNFIRGYEGGELRKWDIAFANGDSQDTVDILGEGHEFRYPTRQFSVENAGRILKMNGSKRRLGTSSVGRFGIENNQEKIDKAMEVARVRAEKKASSSNKSVPVKINISQKDYFTKDIERNPLLTIYFVGLTKLTKDETEENIAILNKCKDTLYIGFGIGIPTLKNQKTKYARYMLNKVARQKLTEGEVDSRDDDGEEFDD